MRRIRGCCLSLLFVFVGSCSAVFAQSNPVIKAESEYSEEVRNPAHFQPFTSAILVNGSPTLRISNRNGLTAEIRTESRDGEESLVFPVLKMLDNDGRLYITKTKVIFVPTNGGKEFFKVEKSKLLEIKLQGGSRMKIPMLVIGFEGANKKFVPQPYDMQDRATTLATITFMSRALTEFDDAIAEFKKLTASVQPELEDPIEEDPEAVVITKYDRFKDKTLVQTSKLSLQGGRRPLKSYVELSYTGKDLSKLEKITWFFFASGSRAIFREDNMEFNVLVDGQHLRLGNARLIDEDKTKSTVKQTLGVQPSIDDFKRIANAKTVEFQIGVLEYKISDVQLALFRDAINQ